MAPAIKAFDEYPFGVSWVLEESLQRTSHALVVDGRVWLVDPVDVPEAIERATRSGRRPACSSCSTATTATAPRSPGASACRT